MKEEQKLRRPKSDRVERTPARKGNIEINASRLYLMTNAQMVPVEQRQALYAQFTATTFCFGAFRTPEAIVVALLATEQAMTHLQEQFRVQEFELWMTEQDYLAELYQLDEVIPLKKEL